MRVSALTLGGACWLEAIKSPNDVLPEVGDEVKMVNSRLVDGIKGVDALFTGEEGTSVEIVVEKCDNSGIFTCHLTRRPLI